MLLVFKKKSIYVFPSLGDGYQKKKKCLTGVVPWYNLQEVMSGKMVCSVKVKTTRWAVVRIRVVARFNRVNQIRQDKKKIRLKLSRTFFFYF